MKFFRDLHIEMFRDTVVILDIDGTIYYDNDYTVLIPEQEKINALKSVAKKVILLSNGEHARTSKLSERHGVFYHNSIYKKPHTCIIRDIKKQFECEKDEIVVIGDKFMTDGLLAFQTGVRFIHVQSLQQKNEGFIQKSIYITDDILGKIVEYIKLLRPQQWIKNLLVFTPAFFAGEMFASGVLMRAFLVFVVFSLSASLVYVLNDIQDIQSDGEHYKKKWRPLPSGNVLVLEALFLTIILFSVLTYAIVQIPGLLPVISLYVVLNIFYTLKFKQIPVFDVVLISSMYVMRVVAGGIMTGFVVSPWIIVCTFFASLFLISCKRYVEFQNPARVVLKRYSKESLIGLLITSANLSIISYVIYTILGTHIEYVVYTSPFVVAAFLIILNDIFNGEKGLETPELYLIKNRHVSFVIVSWFVCMFVLVYNSLII